MYIFIFFINRLFLRAKKIKLAFVLRLSICISFFIKSPTKITKLTNFVPIGNIKVGEKMVNGEHIFGNVLLTAEIGSPWDAVSPSQEVEHAISSFLWLNDLSALGNFKSKKLVYNWLGLWLETYDLYQDFKNPLKTIADRLVNVARNIILIEQSLSDSQRKRLIQIVCLELRCLQMLESMFLPNYERFRVLVGIYYGLMMLDFDKEKIITVQKKLIEVLSTIIDKKGAIISRNPEQLLEIFFVLSEILKNSKAKCYSRNRKDFLAMQRRIAPILRGLRLGSGGLTRIHGGDIGISGLADKLLCESRLRGGSKSVDVLGVERLTAGRLVLLLDCGEPPSNSDNAHAACLSFELSSGQRPIFVNCGPGARFGKDYKRFCRTTRAHNTCSLEGISQSEFKQTVTGSVFPAEVISRGPKNIKKQRGKSIDASWVESSHDGYLEHHGVIHKRKLLLLNTGRTLSGTDIFTKSLIRSGNQDRFKIVAYFHLHPDVEITDHPHSKKMILRLLNGEHWIFETELGIPALEESSYIDLNNSMPVASKAISIGLELLNEEVEFNWLLRRREIVSRNTRDRNIFSK